MKEKIHIPLYMVSKNLSVSLLPDLTPVISGLAKQNGLKLFKDIYGKKTCLKIFCLSIKWQVRPGPRGQNSYILTQHLRRLTWDRAEILKYLWCPTKKLQHWKIPKACGDFLEIFHVTSYSPICFFKLTHKLQIYHGNEFLPQFIHFVQFASTII